jgi:hypothetical protein
MTWWQAVLIYLAIILTVIAVCCFLAGSQKKPPLPECIGSDPGPQQQAENDCWACYFQNVCQRMSATK